MKLVLENVTKSFGGLRAVGDVSFSVDERVIFGLIGPNGAGKTTVFNLVTGVYKPDAGRIRFGETDLAALPPARIAGAGIGRTFQNIRLFSQLTVIENLLVACELQKKAHLASAVLRLPAHYSDERAMHARALELLRVFDLQAMADDAPTSLSYGNQRRLEIARAMMLEPKVLLLDEPAAGMNYGEAEGLKTQIRWLRDTFELAVVLVEHNMQVVMGVCEEIHVLDHGETIAHGTPAEVRRHPKVLAAYLGEDEDELSASAAASARAGGGLGAPAAPRGASAAEASAPEASAPEAAGPPKKLSEPELAALSSELTRTLERGLSQPEASEVAPPDTGELAPPDTGEVARSDEDPPSRPDARELGAMAADSAESLLANLDEVEVAKEPERPAAPPAEPSGSELTNLDSGWGSDDDVAAHDPEPSAKPGPAGADEPARSKNGTNGTSHGNGVAPHKKGQT